MRISMVPVLAVLFLFSPGVTALGASDEPLRIGIAATEYPPFVTAAGGFSREIGSRLAADLGFESVEWVPFAWPELHERFARGDFTLVISGITWRPERAVLGPMSRALAAGGPCLVGDPEGQRVAVNAGGFLEAWSRRRYPDRTLVPVADNATLPELLASGAVAAFVTDSFEVEHFARAEDRRACEPPIERKVLWIARDAAHLLGPVDQWIRDREEWLQEQRALFLGARMPRDALDHLVDLMARRLALMPAVAAWKAAAGVPIEDRDREQRVLRAAGDRAVLLSLDRTGVESLFDVQIELAKQVQQRWRAGDAEALDLETELRPTLLQLGERIIDALAEALPITPEALSDSGAWLPLEPWLTVEQIGKLQRAIAEVEVLERAAVRLRPAGESPVWAMGDSPEGRVRPVESHSGDPLQ